MNSILLKSARMPSFTYLREVFRAIGGRQREFTWLLTDLLVGGYQFGQSHNEGAFVVTGDTLTRIVGEHDPQFIWGVLSGFLPGEEPDITQLAVVPFADENTAFWKPDVQIQYPTAQVEIVCFDSAFMMLLSRDNDLSQRFRAYFPRRLT